MSPTVDLVAALEHAVRAPSVHNTQPWRWRIRAGSVELHADWTRHLSWTDPDRRDLLLSCGAALHHLRVALAAQHLAVTVDRFPDPDHEGHLATVTIRPGPGDPAEAALFGAIHRRRTDRRRMSRRPVPPRMLRAIAEHARRQGTNLHPITNPDTRERLARALADAAREQRNAPGYSAELQLWTRRHAGARDGISAASVAAPPVGATGGSPLRLFPRAQLRQPPLPAGSGPADDAAELLIVTCAHDEPVDRLRAGEATSAALLAATNLGLATTPLSQAIEISSTRRTIRGRILPAPEYPQLILRIGWPASHAGELPVTDRRDLRSVLLPTAANSGPTETWRP
ncbi:Acg family FMN-binding oxidoreductase [Pseudonocardia acaciae]|uniref:Acg family FMN-binding oxidoreductase n=1 Tax=Pseudonocardia acaciae TaxID=551276 RepID=UPI000685A305|nr:nitroreductase family protein [Pseudonocardia acaciae]